MPDTNNDAPTTRPAILDKLSPTMQQALADRCRYSYRSISRNGSTNARTFDALQSRGLIETETRGDNWQRTVIHRLTDEAIEVGRWVLEHGIEKRVAPIKEGSTAAKVLAWLKAELAEYCDGYQGEPGEHYRRYCAMYRAESIAGTLSLKLSTAKGALRRLQALNRLRVEEGIRGFSSASYGAKFTRAQLDRIKALDAAANERQEKILDGLRERGLGFVHKYDHSTSITVSIEAIGQLLGIVESSD